MWTYNPKADIVFKKGLLFTNIDAFRAVLKDYVIQKGFPIMRLKNEKSKVIAICGVEGCKWRIHASPVADSITFMIKTYQGPFGGVFLTAATLDANNSIFPIAFAVGLNIAYEEIVPVASGRHCCRHICSNFKAQFSDILLSNLFWRATKSFDVTGHNETMASIKELNIEAWKYLDKISKTTWCRYTFNTRLKCDHITNNCTESFNAWIGELRGKPILTLVDRLRKKFMKKMHKRYQKGYMLTTAITPKMVDKLQRIGQVSRQCELTMAFDDVFEVGDMNRFYIVNLPAKSYDCGAFQISGLPCKYAALEIIYKRQKLESYCEHWFSRDMYLKTYASMIHPIPDEKMWSPMPHVTPAIVLAPLLRRAPGRPKMKRRREHDEGQSTSQPKRWSRFKCGNCDSFSHNKRSCQVAPV
ncbi:uncharacterized protein [Coffea arabica]|uniref:Transposase MuDR plant domain-containing protein n=1 Tax=Coffea arabica TaxID=13443 RepID=A0A6P6W4H7_COFAR|nr:uncharacterized protein LOC113729349 [Coffea arabica]